MARLSADRPPRRRCRTITSRPIAEDPVDVEIFADEIDAKVASRVFNLAYLSGARSFRRSAPATEPGSARSLKMYKRCYPNADNFVPSGLDQTNKVAGVREAIEAVGATLLTFHRIRPTSTRSSRPSVNSRHIYAKPLSAPFRAFCVGSVAL
jgi:hypothetical protein